MRTTSLHFWGVCEADLDKVLNNCFCQFLVWPLLTLKHNCRHRRRRRGPVSHKFDLVCQLSMKYFWISSSYTVHALITLILKITLIYVVRVWQESWFLVWSYSQESRTSAKPTSQSKTGRDSRGIGAYTEVPELCWSVICLTCQYGNYC